MSRIAARFASLRAAQRTALIPYITAGDPQPAVTVPLMHALVEAGADLIELGVPFSDPMADGPVNQAACERALAHHVSLRDVLAMVREFRAQDTTTPVILMGYLNPIEILGYEIFAHTAAAAGVDGVITVDLPPEEAHDFVEILTAQNLEAIFLLAPTSTPERMAKICQISRGFVYYVSLKGVTGATTLDSAAVAQKIAQIRTHTTLPVGVGFGIRDAASAQAIGRHADAVVVGSILVQRIGELAATPARIPQEIATQVRALRSALDARA